MIPPTIKSTIPTEIVIPIQPPRPTPPATLIFVAIFFRAFSE
ncbi:hypothetical protein V2P41_03190 [Mesomycoplasma hyopneumoniae]